MYHKRHDENAYVAYVRGKRCNDAKSFFYEISASFQFPFYFGENWDALDECLQDLEWLKFEKIVLVISNYSVLLENNIDSKKTALRCITSAMKYWDNENISFDVIINN
jgi:RNAse (barnase) inhibitor barstar